MLRDDLLVAPNHSCFQVFFESADVFATLWQPMLKSVGRLQLEIAGFGVKQTQAVLEFSRDLARSTSPADAFAANARYWDAMTAQVADSSHRLNAAASRAVDMPLVSEVVKLPVKRTRDVIQIPENSNSLADRKVA